MKKQIPAAIGDHIVSEAPAVLGVEYEEETLLQVAPVNDELWVAYKPPKEKYHIDEGAIAGTRDVMFKLAHSMDPGTNESVYAGADRDTPSEALDRINRLAEEVREPVIRERRYD